jgi:hypothetical protein
MTRYEFSNDLQAMGSWYERIQEDEMRSINPTSLVARIGRLKMRMLNVANHLLAYQHHILLVT